MEKPDDRDTSCANSCPVARTADIISGRWTTLIFRELLGGTRRFSELQRSLPGISAKMLGTRLQFLQEQEMVAKKIYPEVPPRTEYTLTERGLGFRIVIAAMAEFGETLPQEPNHLA